MLSQELAIQDVNFEKIGYTNINERGFWTSSSKSSFFNKRILGTEVSVKNRIDMSIFHTAKCGAGATFSFYHRAKSEILLVVPST